MSATQSKRLRAAAQVVVTANRLCDGAVLWRRGDGGWSIHFHEAEALAPDNAAGALAGARADEAARIVVGSYAAPLDAAAQPVSWKERIRAFGPTVTAAGVTAAGITAAGITAAGGLHGQR